MAISTLLGGGTKSSNLERNMSNHSADSIVRIAQAGGGPIVVGGSLSADSIVRIVQCPSAAVTVKAGNFSADSLVRIVQAGGSRVTIDFS